MAQRIRLPRFRTSLPLTVPCSACLRSTAARRLAQNAPPEHFAGFQPSLPRSAPSVVLNLGRCQKHHLLCIWGLAHFNLPQKKSLFFIFFLIKLHKFSLLRELYIGNFFPISVIARFQSKQSSEKPCIHRIASVATPITCLSLRDL